jgi:hypothetical protein
LTVREPLINSKFPSLRRLEMIGLSIILAILPLACLAGETRSLARSIDPLEVSGSEVSNMTGVEVSHLRVISSRNGKLTPIPFQIDQKNSLGRGLSIAVCPQASGTSCPPFGGSHVIYSHTC